MKKLIIAIDPSKWGMRTSGTGLAWTHFENNNFDIDIDVIFGKTFQNQNEYNSAVCFAVNQLINNFLVNNGKQEDIIVRIEEYVEYQKAVTKYTVNGVSEMIGALKYAITSTYPKVCVKMRNAQSIKTRWPILVLERKKLINPQKDVATKLIVGYNKSGDVSVDSDSYAPLKAKHDLDAYRHLVDEIYFRKW